jgi:hypothetical protein
MGVATVTLLVALAAAPQAGVTGKWDGTISGQRPDGTTSSDAALLILEQKDKSITGTIGRDEADRHPIVKGTIDGNKITLTARNTRNDREWQLELTVEKDELKGTIVMGDRTGQVHAKKRKE